MSNQKDADKCENLTFRLSRHEPRRTKHYNDSTILRQICSLLNMHWGHYVLLVISGYSDYTVVQRTKPRESKMATVPHLLPLPFV